MFGLINGALKARFVAKVRADLEEIYLVEPMIASFSVNLHEVNIEACRKAGSSHGEVALTVALALQEANYYRISKRA